LILIGNVSAKGIFEFSLPVEADGSLNMALIISVGVNVYFNEFEAALS
jgi:hypothetical protein